MENYSDVIDFFLSQNGLISSDLLIWFLYLNEKKKQIQNLLKFQKKKFSSNENQLLYVKLPSQNDEW